MSNPGRARPPPPGPVGTVSLTVALWPTPLSCKARSLHTVSPSLIRTPEPTPKGSSDLTEEVTVESPEPVLRSPCSAGQSFRCCPSSGSRRTFRGRRRAATPSVPSEVRSRQRLDVSHPLARRRPCASPAAGTRLSPAGQKGAVRDSPAGDVAVGEDRREPTLLGEPVLSGSEGCLVCLHRHLRVTSAPFFHGTSYVVFPGLCPTANPKIISMSYGSPTVCRAPCRRSLVVATTTLRRLLSPLVG